MKYATLIKIDMAKEGLGYQDMALVGSFDTPEAAEAETALPHLVVPLRDEVVEMFGQERLDELLAESDAKNYNRAPMVIVDLVRHGTFGFIGPLQSYWVAKTLVANEEAEHEDGGGSGVIELIPPGLLDFEPPEGA